VKSYWPRLLAKNVVEDRILRIAGVMVEIESTPESEFPREKLIWSPLLMKCKLMPTTFSMQPHWRTQLEKNLQQSALSLHTFGLRGLIDASEGDKIFCVVQHIIRNYRIHTVDSIFALTSYALLWIEIAKSLELKERISSEKFKRAEKIECSTVIQQIFIDFIATGQIELGLLMTKNPKYLQNLMIKLCSTEEIYFTAKDLYFFRSNQKINWNSHSIKSQFLDIIIQLLFANIPHAFPEESPFYDDLKEAVKAAREIFLKDRIENLSICIGYLLVRDEFARAKGVLEQIQRECSDLFEPILKALSDHAYTVDASLFAQCLKFSSSLPHAMRDKFLLGLSGVTSVRLQENFLHRNLEIAVRINDPRQCVQILIKLFYSLFVSGYEFIDQKNSTLGVGRFIIWLGSFIELMGFYEIREIISLYLKICKKINCEPWNFTSLQPSQNNQFSLFSLFEKFEESLHSLKISFSCKQLRFYEKQKVEPGTAEEKARRFIKEMDEVRSLEEHWKVRAELRKNGILLPMAPPADVSHLSDAELIALHNKMLIAHQRTQAYIEHVLRGNLLKEE